MGLIRYLKNELGVPWRAFIFIAASGVCTLINAVVQVTRLCTGYIPPVFDTVGWPIVVLAIIVMAIVAASYLISGLLWCLGTGICVHCEKCDRSYRRWNAKFCGGCGKNFRACGT